jgi:hypothetical protein
MVSAFLPLTRLGFPRSMIIGSQILLQKLAKINFFFFEFLIFLILLISSFKTE